MKVWHFFAIAALPLVLLLGLVIWSSARTNGAAPLSTATAAAVQPTAAAPPGTQQPSGGGASVTIVAKNLAFDQTDITVKAGQEVTVTFDNQDNGIPHNIHFAMDSGYSQTIDNAKTDVATGPAKQTLTFTAPAQPGSYFFRCDVHPTQMKGTLTVQ